MQKNVAGTFKDLEVYIAGQNVPLDHIKQINLYSGIGILGHPGDITITIDSFVQLMQAYTKGLEFNPIGWSLIIAAEDMKHPGKRFIHSVRITGCRFFRNIKTDLVMITFDYDKALAIQSKRWWQAFEKCTIGKIFVEFGKQCGFSFANESYYETLGTWWENFAIPQNIPTLHYLLGELKKDNIYVFKVFSEGDDYVLGMASWYNIQEHQNIFGTQYPPSDLCDYPANALLNFNSIDDEWKKTTFVRGKQVDQRWLTNIVEWDARTANDVVKNNNHDSAYYSGLKKPTYETVKDSTLLPNDIDIQNHLERSGAQVKDAYIAQVLTNEAIIPNSDYPGDYNGGWDALYQLMFPSYNNDAEGGYPSHQSIFPRYMYFRSRENQSSRVNDVKASIVVTGSLWAKQTMSQIPISYYPNINHLVSGTKREENSFKHPYYSGTYLIIGCQLSITGNIMMAHYSLMKPDH